MEFLFLIFVFVVIICGKYIDNDKNDIKHGNIIGPPKIKRPNYKVRGFDSKRNRK